MPIILLPESCDIQLVRETDNEISFVIKDENGKALDIDADLIEWTISDAIGGNQVFQKDSLAGAHLDGPNGRVQFKVTKANTSTAKSTSTTVWHHELKRIKANTDELVHISGRFIVEPTGPA